MSDASKVSPLSFREAISRRTQKRIMGRTVDEWIATFFGSSATISILILFLIMALLVKEGIGFVPGNAFNLTIYRKAGLEYVDYLREQIDRHDSTGQVLQSIRTRETTVLLNQGRTLDQINADLAPFDAYSARYADAIAAHQAMLSDFTDAATSTKDLAHIAEEKRDKKEQFEKGGLKEEAAAIKIPVIDFRATTDPLRAAFPHYKELNASLVASLGDLLKEEPALPLPEDRAVFAKFKARVFADLSALPETERKMEQWNPDAPISWWRSVGEFVGGTRWVTASFWQDWYGALPLVIGSISVSLVALVIAVPLSLGAAVYINQIATAKEQSFIKPCIEFIAAIPSVVLGFFGIAILGTALREFSTLPWLSWVPGFPMAERLNIFTAGCLLALMAVPTIFTLAEDALNNVPKSFVEASVALGATRLQTITRIMVPAALSGIISAVLLGFGRVVGETMVVLLCVGGRTEIPDFIHHGLGAFFEPGHTMTGIIAQEMGEVVQGSLHYQALFMVGILLFLLSLVINGMAQLIARRFKIVSN
ncbi:phosphate transport system permease protein [Verrucomicrobium sp. GAS474]|uniref:phosphate ABC transporter permease subunit PstC n=1 Tax=Verrucomicrobium sp. GAS474 TaxID=1882831 RepID=UPI00087AF7F3|nr:phosphate ABC transporter permease subunit PstC [Verrucomicrobium sp. GAS474]SDU04420.1 phosphate transport system permease protein [Verrucomicrobium sp. GAS474]